MSTLRRLYTESPYAAVLDNEYLQIRCSHCFAEAKNPCEKCKKVVYCNQQCVNADRSTHEFECQSFQREIKAQNSTDIHSVVRLMGRVAARLRADRGVAKGVAEGLPQGVKSYTFSDLPTPSRRARKKMKAQDEELGLLSKYTCFFIGTPLDSKKKLIRSLRNVVVKNIVHTKQISAESKVFATGEAIYLNKCRFGHSCVPDVAMHLENGSSWRVIVSLIVRQGDGPSPQMTNKRFNELKLDYSRSMATPQNGYLSLTRLRRSFVLDEYALTCRCVKCSDSKVMDLEENAAAYECEKCGRAYVWIDDSADMKPSCRCKTAKPARLEGDQERIRLELQLLNIQFVEIMERSDVLGKSGQSFDTEQVILHFETLLRLAQRYWHPSVNLRLAQIFIKLFFGYNAKLRPDMMADYGWKPHADPSVPYERVWATSAARYAEQALAILEYHRSIETYEIHYAFLCARIGVLWGIAGDQGRSKSWLTKRNQMRSICEQPKKRDVVVKS